MEEDAVSSSSNACSSRTCASFPCTLNTAWLKADSSITPRVLTKQNAKGHTKKHPTHVMALAHVMEKNSDWKNVHSENPENEGESGGINFQRAALPRIRGASSAH